MTRVAKGWIGAVVATTGVVLMIGCGGSAFLPYPDNKGLSSKVRILPNDGRSVITGIGDKGLRIAGPPLDNVNEGDILVVCSPILDSARAQIGHIGGYMRLSNGMHLVPSSKLPSRLRSRGATTDYYLIALERVKAKKVWDKDGTVRSNGSVAYGTSTGSSTRGFIHSIAHAVTSAAHSVAHVATNAANDVTNAATNATNDVTNAATDATHAVTNAATDATNAVTNAANDATNAVTNTATNATNDVTNAANDVANEATNLAGNAANDATNAANDITNGANQVTEDANQAAQNAGQSLADAESAVATSVTNAIGPITNEVVTEIEGVAAEFAQLWDGATLSISGGLPDLNVGSDNVDVAVAVNNGVMDITIAGLQLGTSPGGFIEVDGNISFQPYMNSTFTFGNQVVNSVTGYLSANASANITISGGGTYSGQWSKEGYQTEPFIIPAGDVPIVVTPVINVKSVVQGDFQAVNVQGAVAGTVYWNTGSSGPITPGTNNFQASGSGNFPLTEAVTVNPAGLFVTFNIYDLAGPYFEIDPLTVTGALNSQQTQIDLTLGLDIQAGINLDPLGFKGWSVGGNIIGYSYYNTSINL